jgi:hypothetical protein
VKCYKSEIACQKESPARFARPFQNANYNPLKENPLMIETSGFLGDLCSVSSGYIHKYEFSTASDWRRRANAKGQKIILYQAFKTSRWRQQRVNTPRQTMQSFSRQTLEKGSEHRKTKPCALSFSISAILRDYGTQSKSEPPYPYSIPSLSLANFSFQRQP